MALDREGEARELRKRFNDEGASQADLAATALRYAAQVIRERGGREGHPSLTEAVTWLHEAAREMGAKAEDPEATEASRLVAWEWRFKAAGCRHSANRLQTEASNGQRATA